MRPERFERGGLGRVAVFDAVRAAAGARICISWYMRFRIVLLFLLASLLGTPVLLNRMQTQDACAHIPDPAMCAAVAPTPVWVRPLGILSLLVLLYLAYRFATAWAERRREKDLLDAVGVHVREDELPLEE